MGFPERDERRLPKLDAVNQLWAALTVRYQGGSARWFECGEFEIATIAPAFIDCDGVE